MRRTRAGFGRRRSRRGIFLARTERLGDLGGVFVLPRQDHDALAQGHFVAGRVVDMSDGTVVIRLHLHGRLVGLNFRQDVALLDRIADLDQPLRDHARFHRGTEFRHGDFDRHVCFLHYVFIYVVITLRVMNLVTRGVRATYTYKTECTAATIRSTEGSIEASSARL